jgi:hypothetical protein
MNYQSPDGPSQSIGPEQSKGLNKNTHARRDRCNVPNTNGSWQQRLMTLLAVTDYTSVRVPME